MCSNANRICSLEKEIHDLSTKLEEKKFELERLRVENEQNASINENSLSNSDISRFSRQIILPEIGVKGQVKLKNAKILIVGGGGLGR